MCHSCWQVFDRRRSYCPDPRDWDAQRGAISEALTGVPQPTAAQVPRTLKAFGEVATEGHVGGEPWSHLDPATVRAYCWDQQALDDGRYAPP
jgi:hypothetical protein